MGEAQFEQHSVGKTSGGSIMKVLDTVTVQETVQDQFGKFH